MEQNTKRVSGDTYPPEDHKGYAVIARRRVMGLYKYYGTAKAASSGGIVIRAEDIGKYGYHKEEN